MQEPLSSEARTDPSRIPGVVASVCAAALLTLGDQRSLTQHHKLWKTCTGRPLQGTQVIQHPEVMREDVCKEIAS